MLAQQGTRGPFAAITRRSAISSTGSAIASSTSAMPGPSAFTAGAVSSGPTGSPPAVAISTAATPHTSTTRLACTSPFSNRPASAPAATMPSAQAP
jgi:hypothetical protein